MLGVCVLVNAVLPYTSTAKLPPRPPPQQHHHHHHRCAAAALTAVSAPPPTHLAFTLSVYTLPLLPSHTVYAAAAALTAVFPPTPTPTPSFMCPHSHVQSQCVCVELCPGDALYIPEGWWHQVDSAGVCEVFFWGG